MDNGTFAIVILVVILLSAGITYLLATRGRTSTTGVSLDVVGDILEEHAEKESEIDAEENRLSDFYQERLKEIKDGQKKSIVDSINNPDELAEYFKDRDS